MTQDSGLKTVLVTGGLGFIGTNLVAELQQRGHEVWVCDLRHSEGQNYIRCDVTKYRQLERLFEEHNFDYVYHLVTSYISLTRALAFCQALISFKTLYPRHYI